MVVETERRRLYTIPQVVEQTGFSRSTVYEQIASGRLRAVKLGRSVRVTTDELDRWIAELSEAGR